MKDQNGRQTYFRGALSGQEEEGKRKVGRIMAGQPDAIIWAVLEVNRTGRCHREAIQTGGEIAPSLRDAPVPGNGSARTTPEFLGVTQVYSLCDDYSPPILNQHPVFMSLISDGVRSAQMTRLGNLDRGYQAL